MTSSRARRTAQGCFSETGRLRKVVMCPPTHFEIVEPTNHMQWVYWSDGLPRPNPLVMTQQHKRLLQILREEGVEVELLLPLASLPFQHATRDVGAVIGDTIVLANLRERTRRLEAEVAEPVLARYGLRLVRPERGFVEGGDVVVDGSRLWVGIGARTDEWGAEFLHQNFGRDREVVPLRFDRRYTHLDTVFGVLGRDRALVYEAAFDEASLQRIRKAYPDLITLTEEEQKDGGANVLFLDPEKVISIAENGSVNAQLAQAGFEVVTLPYSEVIKSGGSVRCDTLPVEREPVSLR
jgi:N-dimethylarginine dimethylaminohydrolase